MSLLSIKPGNRLHLGRAPIYRQKIYRHLIEIKGVQAEWFEELRSALVEVEKVRTAGPMKA